MPFAHLSLPLFDLQLGHLALNQFYTVLGDELSRSRVGAVDAGAAVLFGLVAPRYEGQSLFSIDADELNALYSPRRPRLLRLGAGIRS